MFVFIRKCSIVFDFFYEKNLSFFKNIMHNAVEVDITFVI